MKPTAPPHLPIASTRRARLIGSLAVFASAFCFYLATVIIRWSEASVAIDPAFFVFARFLLRFIVVCTTMAIARQPLRPVRWHYLIGRTVFNCIAVFCFFKAVSVTTVAQANILNMTYPLFIAIFTWFWLREQRDPAAMVLVVAAFAGVWLVLSPGGMGFSSDSLWGILSGLTASAAIVYLDLSRQYHDTHTILFVMFGLGGILILILFHEHVFMPGPLEAVYLLLCAAAGVAGQYLLTLGFRFVTAVEGGIISSTRILLAALLGPLLVSDLPLGLYGWTGALLIFGANVYLTIRRVASG